VVAKAAFLLETAYFVNRCNRKDWPEWLKMNIGICRPYGSFQSSKSVPNMAKRNKIYQLAAANIFCAWAEVLSSKLESIMKQNDSNGNNEPDLSPEDFFDDSKLFFKQLVLKVKFYVLGQIVLNKRNQNLFRLLECVFYV
jgi:hypothetical protein